MLRLLAAAMFAACSGLAALAQTELPVFNVFGTTSNLANYSRLERPFFAEELPRVIGPTFKANIKPSNELSLEGPQLLRLLKQGVFDFGAVLESYVEDGGAIAEGADLAGLAPDPATARAILDAWRPEIARMLREQHNAVLLATFALAEQDIFCRGDVKTLEELKGKKVRVHTPSQSDLMTGLGATPLNMSYAATFPALEKSAIDCALTSAMSAYRARWQDVTGSILRVPAGYTTGMLVANADTWRKLPPATRTQIEAAARSFAENAWALAASETQDGIGCLTGNQPCAAGASGKMKVNVAPDLALRDKALAENVVKAWAERCGKECAARWNTAIGSRIGLRAATD